MRRGSIFYGIVLAIIVSALVLPLTLCFSLLLGGAFLIKAVVTVATFLYVLMLFAYRDRMTGIFILGLGTVLILGISTVLFSLFVHISLCVFSIWMLRSVLRYRSILPVAADGLLCILAGMFAIFGVGLTGSVLFAVWCFLLVQALHVLIPQRLDSGSVADDLMERDVDTFSRAFMEAERAVSIIAKSC